MTTIITELKPIFHSMKFNKENTQALFSFLQKHDLKVSDILYPEKSKNYNIIYELIHFFIKNSNNTNKEDYKVKIKDLIEFNNNEYKDSILIQLKSMDKGISLLDEHQQVNEKIFETLFFSYKIKNITEFLAIHPNSKSEMESAFNNIISSKKYFNHTPIQFVLGLEKVGINLEKNIIPRMLPSLNMILENNALKNFLQPQKLVPFIFKHKNSISNDDWDLYMTTIIKANEYSLWNFNIDKFVVDSVLLMKEINNLPHYLLEFFNCNGIKGVVTSRKERLFIDNNNTEALIFVELENFFNEKNPVFIDEKHKDLRHIDNFFYILEHFPDSMTEENIKQQVKIIFNNLFTFDLPKDEKYNSTSIFSLYKDIKEQPLLTNQKLRKAMLEIYYSPENKYKFQGYNLKCFMSFLGFGEKAEIKGNQEAYELMIDFPLFKKDIFENYYSNNKNKIKTLIEMDLEFKKTDKVKKIKI